MYESQKQRAGEFIEQPAHLFTAGQPICQERCETAGKGIARRADKLPLKEKQPGKSFTGRVLAGCQNSREKTFAGSSVAGLGDLSRQKMCPHIWSMV
jgi:hypothetical protein